MVGYGGILLVEYLEKTTDLYFRNFFVCSLSPSIINCACPNFQTTYAMELMFTLQHEFELSTLPSIPSMFVAYVNSCFYYNFQKLLFFFFF